MRQFIDLQNDGIISGNYSNTKQLKIMQGYEIRGYDLLYGNNPEKYIKQHPKEPADEYTSRMECYRDIPLLQEAIEFINGYLFTKIERGIDKNETFNAMLENQQKETGGFDGYIADIIGEPALISGNVCIIVESLAEKGEKHKPEDIRYIYLPINNVIDFNIINGVVEYVIIDKQVTHIKNNKATNVYRVYTINEAIDYYVSKDNNSLSVNIVDVIQHNLGICPVVMSYAYKNKLFSGNVGKPLLDNAIKRFIDIMQVKSALDTTERDHLFLKMQAPASQIARLNEPYTDSEGNLQNAPTISSTKFLPVANADDPEWKYIPLPADFKTMFEYWNRKVDDFKNAVLKLSFNPNFNQSGESKKYDYQTLRNWLKSTANKMEKIENHCHYISCAWLDINNYPVDIAKYPNDYTIDTVNDLVERLSKVIETESFPSEFVNYLTKSVVSLTIGDSDDVTRNKIFSILDNAPSGFGIVNLKQLQNDGVITEEERYLLHSIDEELYNDKGYLKPNWKTISGNKVKNNKPKEVANNNIFGQENI